MVQTDFEQLFDQKTFLRCFQSSSVQEVRYLELFTSMSLFTRLVERVVLSQTKDDILISRLIHEWPNMNLSKQDVRGAAKDL